MADDTQTSDVVVSAQPEVQHVRIGGSAGLRVTHSSISAPTTHKRVTALNDEDRTVRLSREVLAELHELTRSSEPDALERIRALLPTVEI